MNNLIVILLAAMLSVVFADLVINADGFEQTDSVYEKVSNIY